jgi:hypothetical protein
MSNKKTLQEYKPQTISVYTPQQVTHVTGSEKGKPKVAFPLMILFVAFIFFLLAYAGSDIGRVLGYLIIPAFAFFPAFAAWERYGKVAGVAIGLLFIAVIAPAYGNSTIAHMVAFFTSLQQISQGVLVSLAGVALIGSAVSFIKGNR